ncbi:hypothetical protein CHS0354_020634 [Potamilus streckersoni]|uniref:Uncharacterized protein n=1 Tax=Potamilus streckersoni TaxID=2493646 RepID=A0AAE0T2J6_9BIVA|nr:hypothetical protein CHS0354_020634 [Potamilus streckersoni]
MSLKSVLHVVCLSLAVANVYSYCCSRHKFEATLEITGAIIHSIGNTMIPINGYAHLFYDYEGKRQRLNSHILQPDGSYRNSTTINLYSLNKQYTMEGAHQCTEYRLHDTVRDPCVPDGATFLVNSTIGSGQHSIAVQFFLFNDVAAGQWNKLVVTADDCTPVELTVQGVVEGVDQIYTYTFTKVTPGIRDEKVFDIDKSCLTSHGPPVVG